MSAAPTVRGRRNWFQLLTQEPIVARLAADPVAFATLTRLCRTLRAVRARYERHRWRMLGDAFLPDDWNATPPPSGARHVATCTSSNELAVYDLVVGDSRDGHDGAVRCQRRAIVDDDTSLTCALGDLLTVNPAHNGHHWISDDALLVYDELVPGTQAWDGRLVERDRAAYRQYTCTSRTLVLKVYEACTKRGCDGTHRTPAMRLAWQHVLTHTVRDWIVVVARRKWWVVGTVDEHVSALWAFERCTTTGSDDLSTDTAPEPWHLVAHEPGAPLRINDEHAGTPTFVASPSGKLAVLDAWQSMLTIVPHDGDLLLPTTAIMRYDPALRDVDTIVRYVWAPDDRHMAVFAAFNVSDGRDHVHVWKVVVIDTEQPQRAPLVVMDTGFNQYPSLAWAPDRRLVVVTNDHNRDASGCSYNDVNVGMFTFDEHFERVVPWSPASAGGGLALALPDGVDHDGITEAVWLQRGVLALLDTESRPPKTYVARLST